MQFNLYDAVITNVGIWCVLIGVGLLLYVWVRTHIP